MWTNRSLLLSVFKADVGGCQWEKGLEALSQSKRKPAQYRARLQRKEVRWVSSPRPGQGLPTVQDWPPRYPAWVKGAGLGTPNCQVSFQFPALSLCLLVRMGAFWQLYFIPKRCSTKLNITYTNFSFLFFIYFAYTTWHMGSQYSNQGPNPLPLH